MDRNSRSTALARSPNRAAVIANMGKSQPHTRSFCQQLNTLSNVERIIAWSTPSPGSQPNEPINDG